MNNTSFRDPAGCVFKLDNVFYRKINKCYKEDYEHFISSGLYNELVKLDLLLSHEEIEQTADVALCKDANFYKLIKPTQINYISYPYEWCFSALKDAALLTLKIQKISLRYSMILKDASAYNIQFLGFKPIFIDTLSFQKYNEGMSWDGYKQFCSHFLAPLALMAYNDISLNKLLIANIDGIPLNVVVNLLPFKARLNPLLFIHIYLHSLNQKKYESAGSCKNNSLNLDKKALLALIDSLEDCVKSLSLPKIQTEWSNYYNNTNYSNESFADKKTIIEDFLDTLSSKSLCDLGANNGEFSRVAMKRGVEIVSLDIDPMAVEENYSKAKKNKEKSLLPLIQDFTNPSPAIGFSNDERMSFNERFKCDVVMALALIHHLSISNNLPFANIAKFLVSLAPNLIIEFVPKSDSKVQTLLSSREDIFVNYDVDNFEKDFGEYYDILKSVKINGSDRIMYLMRAK